MTIALLVLVAYFLGSLPFGLWVVKALKGIDIREVGSGNIGATNVYRAAGKGAAIAVVLLDMLKGAAPVGLALWLGMADWAAALVGLAAILGHSKSIFLRFSGGKSVATGIGTILALAPAAGLAVLAFWAVLFAVTRTVSVASISAAVVLPGMLWVFKHSLPVLAFGTAAAVYVVVRHRSNIERLLRGEEKRL